MQMIPMGSTEPAHSEELHGSLEAYRNHAATHADAFAGVVTPQLRWLLSRTAASSLVLDVGCGTGRDVRLLRSLGRTAVGIDLVKEMLKGVDGAAVCDARVLPFADLVFEAVFSSAGLVHLDRDTLEVAVCEMVRVAKPNAAFTISLRHQMLRQAPSGWEPSPFGQRWYQRWNAEDLAMVVHGCGVLVEEVSITDDATRRDVAWVAVSGTVR
jgi:SAM-dependent methyltransferase